MYPIYNTEYLRPPTQIFTLFVLPPAVVERITVVGFPVCYNHGKFAGNILKIGKSKIKKS